jgi:hypothetical protein
MLEALGGRKFLLTLIVIAVGMAAHVLSPTGLNESAVALLVGALGVFGASNAAISYKALGAQAAASEEPSQPVASIPIELLETISDLHANVQSQAQTLAAIGQSVDLTNKILQTAMSQNGRS